MPFPVIQHTGNCRIPNWPLMDYYTSHPDEARKIIDNAHQYVEQFKNKDREDLLNLLVLQKYFEHTGQLDTSIAG